MTTARSVRQRLRELPVVGPAGRSARWLGQVWQAWRSPARQFLAYPPGHYHSPLPDPVELDRDAGRVFADPAELPGLDLNRAGQLDLLSQLAVFQADMPFGPEPRPGLRYGFENVFFPYPDGVLLYSMMRWLRPARVIEVGSGHSSAVMLDTDELFLGGRTEFTFIDPHPERLNALLAASPKSRGRVLAVPVQQVPAAEFAALRAGDLLFIDSSHVSKIGSDVNHLFLDVLPRLPTGVVVHIHDIFWPFEYPRHWLDRGVAWNEGYLLRALLTSGRRYEVVCFGSYLERHAAAEWAAALPLAVRRAVSNPLTGAASIWLRVAG